VTVKVCVLQECDVQEHSDVMTKQLAGPRFAQHRDHALGIIDAVTAVIAALAWVWRRIRSVFRLAGV
jgi:hypothetical protein